jgi:hypothetical protein
MILSKLSKALTNVVGPKARNEFNSLQGENTVFDLVFIIVHVCVLVLINGMFGQYLWNNVARKLFSGLGKAEWYDTLLLYVLLSIVIPSNN